MAVFVVGRARGAAAFGGRGGFDFAELVEGGVYFADHFDGGLDVGFSDGRVFPPFFGVAQEVCEGLDGKGFALEMGRVFAGFDFAEVFDGEAARRGIAEFFDVFAGSQRGPHGGGQGVALALFEFFGVFGGQVGALEFPAFGLDLEAGGVVVAATEFDDGLSGLAEGAQLCEGGGVQVLALGGENGAVAEGDGGGEVVGEGLAGGDGLEFLLVGGEVLGVGEEVLFEEPFLVAGVAPVGEVLFADGLGVEFFGEEGLGFGQGVEPLEGGGGFGAVGQAGVELGANVPREAGDFSGACHSVFFGLDFFTFIYLY